MEISQDRRNTRDLRTRASQSTFKSVFTNLSVSLSTLSVYLLFPTVPSDCAFGVNRCMLKGLIRMVLHLLDVGSYGARRSRGRMHGTGSADERGDAAAQRALDSCGRHARQGVQNRQETIRLAEIEGNGTFHSATAADGERETLSDPETERATTTATSTSSRRWRLAEVASRDGPTLAAMANQRFCPFLASETGDGAHSFRAGTKQERTLDRAQQAATFHPRMVGRGQAGAAVKPPGRAVQSKSKSAWKEDERRSKMRQWLLKSGLLPEGAAAGAEDKLSAQSDNSSSKTSCDVTDVDNAISRSSSGGVEGSPKRRGKREMLLHSLWGTEAELGGSLFLPVEPTRSLQPAARVPRDPLPVWTY